MAQAVPVQQPTSSLLATGRDLVAQLNTRWHAVALRTFLVIVVAHWTEHLVQAFQIWGLGMARPAARGVLGMVWPWLISSEALHYSYALLMLLGLLLLRPSYVGQARGWWNLALGIQVWHHFEHFLLLAQVVVGANLFGLAAPTSILQLVLPRVELHLTYNLLVFAPMAVAMYYHLFPSTADRHQAAARGITCTCAVRAV